MLKKGLKTILPAMLVTIVLYGCGTQGTGDVADASAAAPADSSGTEGEEQQDVPADEEAPVVEPSTELKDYYGLNVDDLMADFPDLEITADEGTYDKNGAQYMDKKEQYDGVLAGPTFDVDKDFNIVGITYGGQKFTLFGIKTGMDMQEAIKAAKADGWEFSNVDFAHGTAQYVVNMTKDDKTLTLVSDAGGEFGRSEESDVSGNVATVSVAKNKGQADTGSVGSWKEAYLQVIQDKTTGVEADIWKDSGFALLNIDDDDIPELVCDSWMTAAGEFVFTYYNGEVIEVGDGYTGTNFILGEGLMLSGGGHGNIYEGVSKLDKGQTEVLWSGEIDEGPVNEGDDSTVTKYFSNGAEVEEAQYYKDRDAVFDSSKAVAICDGTPPDDTFIEAMSYDRICEELKP